MSQGKETQPQGNSKVVVAILAMTSSAAVALQSGLVNQMVKVMGQHLMNAASTQALESEQKLISQDWLSQTFAAHSFVIEGETAFLIEGTQNKKLAPDGFYKLPDEFIISVKDGQIINNIVAYALPELDDGTWKEEWRRWGQANVDPGASQRNIAQLNVKETFDKINEA